MIKKLWVLPVLVACLLALGSGAGFAMPSLGGPTGIVSVPNALVAPVGALEVAGTWQKLTETSVISQNMYSDALAAYQTAASRAMRNAQSMYGASTFNEDYNVWGIQALSGITDGAELWAAYQGTSGGDLNPKFWGFGAKYQFMREPKDPFFLAIGASYQKGDGSGQIALANSAYSGPLDVSIDEKVTTAYVALTKNLTPTGIQGSQWTAGSKLYGTVGLMYKKDDGGITVDGVDVSSGSDSLTEPFLGAEFEMSDGTTLGLEYRWKNDNFDDKAVFSAVLRHQIANGFAVELGTTNADPLGYGQHDQNIFVRVGYTFAVGKY